MSTKAILAGYYKDDNTTFFESMEEMKALCLADDIEIVESVYQKGIGPLHSSYFRSGKLEEIRALKEQLEVETVIINDELNTSQIMTMEEVLDCGVVDRTSLILNIFNNRAKTKQARLQVEIAKLEYALPRLLGSYSDLGRQGGVGGARNKGLGEKKIALDKRKINRQIQALKKELKEIKKNHQTQSEGRNSSTLKKVALVGYTNAGKSTLMNALLDNKKHKKVMEKDMLFATLDTSVRLIDAIHKPAFLLSDTVGFIEKLPPILLDAFRTTLEEVKDADLLLHIINPANDNYISQQEATIKTLEEIGVSNLPILKVYTHLDLIDDIPQDGNAVSSITKEGIEALLDTITCCLYGDLIQAKLFFSYSKGTLIHECIQSMEIINRIENEDGVELLVKANRDVLKQYEDYMREI